MSAASTAVGLWLAVKEIRKQTPQNLGFRRTLLKPLAPDGFSGQRNGIMACLDAAAPAK
jgi:hypothetical protein